MTAFHEDIGVDTNTTSIFVFKQTSTSPKHIT